MPDGESTLFTITDLKQYMYCPRIMYFHTCLPTIRPVTFKMDAGIRAHEKEQQTSLRRRARTMEITPIACHHNLAVQSTTLRLSGQVDEVLILDDGIIPVDYKLSRKASYHFEVQLAAYALLLEERFSTVINFGMLYLIPIRKTEKVKITPKLRRTVTQAMEEMRWIEERERIPSPTDWRQRCVDCEFRRFCNDV